MNLFRLRFMINAMALVLMKWVFRFKMVAFIAVLRVVCAFRGFLGLLGSAVVWRASAREVRV